MDWAKRLSTFSFVGHTSLINQSSNCRVSSGRTDGRHLIPVRNKQVGLGLVVFSDQIGVSNTFLSSMSYSYKIKFKPGTRLSIGLQATVLNFNQLFDRLENPDINDVVFQDNISALRFNFGTGIYFETERFYVGGSIPEIYENNLHPGNLSGEKQLRQYFFTGGYLFYLSRIYKFKPTFLVRYTEGLPAQVDINANLLYKDILWTGVSYRYSNSLNFTVEFLLTNTFRIGLAYDYAIGEINKATYGSAEIMLNYIFLKAGKKIINPRYF